MTMNKDALISMPLHVAISIGMQIVGVDVWPAIATAAIFQIVFLMFASDLLFDHGFYRASDWLDSPLFTWGKK